MRLWSIHPHYLDKKGLIALWSETLQAQRVLLQGKYKDCECGCKEIYQGKCVGCYSKIKIKTPYYNHPQLTRWKNKLLIILQAYLYGIYLEAKIRGYNFNYCLLESNLDFLDETLNNNKLFITKGQLIYEFEHLQKKLAIRDKQKFQENYNLMKKTGNIEPHPLFKVVDGEVAHWEKIKK